MRMNAALVIQQEMIARIEALSVRATKTPHAQTSSVPTIAGVIMDSREMVKNAATSMNV